MSNSFRSSWLLSLVILIASMLVIDSYAQTIEQVFETTSEFHVIQFIDHASGTVIAGENRSAIWIGEVGAQNFEKHEWVGYAPGDAVDYVHAHSSDTLFASIGWRQMRTFDRGATWEEVGIDIRGISGLLSLNDSTLLATSFQGIHRSTDLGVTWSEADPAMESGSVSATVFQLTDSILVAGKVYGQEENSHYQFWSYDGGSTWSDSSAVLDKWGGTYAVVSDSQVAIFENRHVYRSLHLESMTWIDTSYPRCDSFAASVGIFLCQDGRDLFESLDSGQNWSQIESGQLPIYSYSKLILNRDTVYFGAQGGLYLAYSLIGTNVSHYPPDLISDACRPYPNPFSKSVSFCIPSDQAVEMNVRVFDTIGRQVDWLRSNDCNHTQCRFKWQPKNLSRGLYFLLYVTEEGHQASSVVKID